MVALKYAKKYNNKYNTTTKKKEKEEKTRTYNVWLSADINSCPTNCTFSKIYLHEG